MLSWALAVVGDMRSWSIFEEAMLYTLEWFTGFDSPLVDLLFLTALASRFEAASTCNFGE